MVAGPPFNLNPPSNCSALGAKRKQPIPTTEDIKSWFDALDLDDYVSFGGKA
jgi:hypothetical protein